MKDYLISMFIDDQLNLDEKVEFVDAVHADGSYKNETVDLLRQEKWLRSDITETVPPMVFEPGSSVRRMFRRLTAPVAAGVAVGIFFLLFFVLGQGTATVSRRFVVYEPKAATAQITGTFTQWQPIDLKPAGNAGYWEITLELTAGEHRFSFLFDGHRHVVDPTVIARERDDFGGENSILEVHT